MPYVKPEIANALDNRRKMPVTAGELTYLITDALRSYLTYHDENGGVRYENYAVCLGALAGAESDLNRRLIWPYEELAQAINGDVWPRHLRIGEGDERESPDHPQDSLDVALRDRPA
jgi:hypothetical protein